MRLTFWNVALVPVCRRWVESSGYHSWHQPDLVGKASIKGISGKMAWAFPRFSLISVCVCATHYPASSIEFLQARYGGSHPILALRWRRQITGGQAHLWPVQASRDTVGKGELWVENCHLYCTDQGVLRAGKMYNWPHRPLLERTWSPQACWPVDSHLLPAYVCRQLIASCLFCFSKQSIYLLYEEASSVNNLLGEEGMVCHSTYIWRSVNNFWGPVFCFSNVCSGDWAHLISLV